MANETFATILRDVYTPKLINTVFKDTTLLDGSIVPIVTPEAGGTISTGYTYAQTSNGGSYAYDAAAPDSDSSSQVKASFNKDPYQSLMRTFNVYRDWHAGGAGNETNTHYVMEAMAGGVRNHRDLVNTALIADLEAQIDAANTYSDTALVRATYDMVSYEEDTSTALTLAQMEDLMEALDAGTSYGRTTPDQAAWFMPRNQITNYGRLGASASSSTPLVFNTSDTNDPGVITKAGSFEGVPIYHIPGMTSTTILYVNLERVKIYETRGLTITPKSELADTELFHITSSYNIVADSPKFHGKLSAKTA